jgi:hypothetical protein
VRAGFAERLEGAERQGRREYDVDCKSDDAYVVEREQT